MLFRSARKSRVALNIGGIANITVLPRGALPEQVIAFDTGPGNMVIDQLVSHLHRRQRNLRLRWRHRRRMLPEPGAAQQAAQGSVLLRAAAQKRRAANSTAQDFIGKLRITGLPVPDLIATATVLTAATIAMGIETFAPGTEEIIASGGGVHNLQLMGQVQAFLPACRLVTSAEFGVDPDAKEAIAFAVLAHRTWRRLPGNLPSATGARHATVLGKVTYGTK